MEAGSEKLPDRAGRRSSVAAEATDGLPGVPLWTVRILSPLLIAGRFLGALLAVGGLVSAAAGLITLDRALIVGGLLQAALCAVLLGLGGSRQHVVEATGRSGSFVICAARPRLWRSARGWQRVRSFVRGDYVWSAAVRRRDEDLPTHP